MFSLGVEIGGRERAENEDLVEPIKIILYKSV